MRRLFLVSLMSLLLVGGVFAGVSCWEGKESPLPSEKNVLSLGESAVVKDSILFTVVEYKLSDSVFCRDRYGHETTIYPKDWATFLWVYVKAENIGEFPGDTPSWLSLSYKGHECWSISVLRCDNIDFYMSKWLDPGEGIKGWKIFEVPKGPDISRVRVSVQIDMRGYPVPPYWKLAP